jgi:hypothetical protein
MDLDFKLIKDLAKVQWKVTGRQFRFRILAIVSFLLFFDDANEIFKDYRHLNKLAVYQLL